MFVESFCKKLGLRKDADSSASSLGMYLPQDYRWFSNFVVQDDFWYSYCQF